MSPEAEHDASVPGAAMRDLLFAPGRGGPPTPDGVRGVVVDVAVGGGVDTVAAFADGTARYLNHAGAAVVWEAVDEEVAARVGALLRSAAPVRAVAGPIPGTVPAPPGPGMAQVAVLAPEGTLTGSGPYEALASNPVAGPVIRAAFELMTALIGRTRATGEAGPEA